MQHVWRTFQHSPKSFLKSYAKAHDQDIANPGTFTESQRRGGTVIATGLGQPVMNNPSFMNMWLAEVSVSCDCR